MSEVQLRVKHNIATYDLKFNEEETLGTLGHKLLELTGFFCVQLVVFGSSPRETPKKNHLNLKKTRKFYCCWAYPSFCKFQDQLVGYVLAEN